MTKPKRKPTAPSNRTRPKHTRPTRAQKEQREQLAFRMVLARGMSFMDAYRFAQDESHREGGSNVERYGRMSFTTWRNICTQVREEAGEQLSAIPKRALLAEQLALAAASASLKRLGLGPIAAAFAEPRLGGVFSHTYGMVDLRHDCRAILDDLCPPLR